jgi:hypothetical protein
MVHRLLDVLMQGAWSLTAFVNLASRQDRILTAIAQRGFSLYQIELPTASVKIVLTV